MQDWGSRIVHGFMRGVALRGRKWLIVRLGRALLGHVGAVRPLTMPSNLRVVRPQPRRAFPHGALAAGQDNLFPRRREHR